MKDENLSKYDPDYPYKKEDVTIFMSQLGYPIIERTNNGLLFPEAPQDKVDMPTVDE